MYLFWKSIYLMPSILLVYWFVSQKLLSLIQSLVLASAMFA